MDEVTIYHEFSKFDCSKMKATIALRYALDLDLASAKNMIDNIVRDKRITISGTLDDVTVLKKSGFDVFFLPDLRDEKCNCGYCETCREKRLKKCLSKLTLDEQKVYNSIKNSFDNASIKIRELIVYSISPGPPTG